MVNKKSNGPPRAVPKPHHSAHLSTTLLASSSNKASTVLLSSFSPRNLRLSFFASVVVGLDSQRLRIHDVSTGRLRCEHVFEKGLTCNSIAWGLWSNDSDKVDKKKKKRKRIADSNGASTEETGETTGVVALGMNKGAILLFSPTEAAIVGSLEGGHTGEVVQFKFENGKPMKGWSAGTDGKLVEWDIRRKTIVSTISLPENSIRTIALVPPISVLCASHTIYSLDTTSPSSAPSKFTASVSPIHTILASSSYPNFLFASEADRYINVLSLPGGKQAGALVAESDVKTVTIEQEGNIQLAAAVTANGIVEIFSSPFTFTAQPGTEISRKQKAITTRKSDTKVRIVRPSNTKNDGKDIITAINASFQAAGELVIAWADNGINVEFEKLQWKSPEDGGLVLKQGVVDIVKANTQKVSDRSLMNGAKDMGRVHLDQSETVVVSGTDVNMLDSTNNQSDIEEEEEEEDSDADADSDSASDSDPTKSHGEPSFYDKFQALEVSASTIPSTSNPTQALAPPKVSKALKPFQGTLTTVLTQALKTNDKALLESCLHTTDSKAILSTVRRLDSIYAVPLIESLAERISRRPGRATSLGAWVRWTLVTHGGYLVSLPNLMRTLAGLHATLATRAGALPKLLQLQGRLDMLSAQLELRNELKRNKDMGETGVAVDEEDDQVDDGVLYIEGKSAEYDDSDSENEGRGRIRRRGIVDGEDSSDEEPEEVGMEGLQIEDASFIKGRVNEEDDDEDEDDSEEDSEADDGDEEEEDSDDEDDNILDRLDSEEDEEDEDTHEKYGGLIDGEAEESDEEDDEGEDLDGMLSDGEDISEEEEEEVTVKVAAPPLQKSSRKVGRAGMR